MILLDSSVIRTALLYLTLSVSLLPAAIHSGLVRAAGQPLPGATVTATLDGQKLTATTDENGLYLIGNLPPGKWTLEVQSFGFTTERRELETEGLPTSATWDLTVKLRVKATSPTLPAVPIVPASQPVPGFVSLEVKKVTDEGAQAAARMSLPDVDQNPQSATEAFLINGSLSQALDAPTEEIIPPTPEALAIWADVIQQGAWGGVPSEEAVVANKGVADPSNPASVAAAEAAAKVAAKAKKDGKPAPRRPAVRPSMAGALSAKSGAPRTPGVKGSGGKSSGMKGMGSRGGKTASSFGNKRKKAIVQGSANLSLRNSALDAQPYSLSGQQIEKSAYANARFGVNMGGPLKLPKIYKRDGTFFYFAYSGVRSRNPYRTVSTMPSALERSGDFSQSATARAPVTIYDLAAGRVPFAGNRIPVSRLNPAALGILTLMPMANLPGSIQNYNYSTSLGSNTNAYSLRLNQVLTRRNRLAWSFNSQTRSGESTQLYGFRDETGSKGLNTEISWTHNFGAKAVNLLKYNLNRNRSETTPYFAYRRNYAAEWGIAGTSQSPLNWGPPNVSFTNFGGLSDAAPVLRRDQSSGVEEGLTYVRGKHNLTFGGGYKHNQLNSRTDSNARGAMSFSGLITSDVDAKGNPLPATGFDFADFLLGYNQSASIRFGSANTYFREHVTSIYTQDDWRVHKSLTLNLGLRYEYFTPYRERTGRMANLDIAQGFTGVSVVTPAQTTGQYTGVFPETLVNPDRNNIGPRIGIAWKSPGKHSVLVRGGYGWYYNGSIYGNFATRLASQPPFARTGTRSTSIANPLTIQDGFAPAPNDKITNTYAVNRYYQVGYAQTWNLSLQRDLPHGLVMELGYLGTKGTHLDIQRYPNRAAPGSPLTAEERRLIGNAVGFVFESAEGNSIYNAGQVRFIRRFRKGMSANLLYTFSKSIDNATTFGGGGTVVAQFDDNLSLERGLSSFDQRHMVQANYYLASPFGDAGSALIRTSGWKTTLLRDWSFSGGITMRSGTPMTARVLGNRADSGGSGVVGSGRAEATGLPIGGEQYFNVLAFGLPPSGRYGNAGRNTVPGVPYFGANLSFGRSFRIHESKRWIDLRVDSSNFTNHPSITGFATVVNARTYGLPTSVGSMRTVTGTLRVRF